MKFERSPRKVVRLSFDKFCDVSGLHAFDKMAISLSNKGVNIRKEGREFM